MVEERLTSGPSVPQWLGLRFEICRFENQNESLQQPVQAVPYKPPYNEEIEFYHFLKTLRVEERGHFLYRDQIRKNINTGCYDVNIDMCHIAGWDPLLEHKLLKSPEKVLLKFS